MSGNRPLRTPRQSLRSGSNRQARAVKSVERKYICYKFLETNRHVVCNLNLANDLKYYITLETNQRQGSVINLPAQFKFLSTETDNTFLKHKVIQNVMISINS